VKITTFDPIIVTPDADSVIKLFEALGFEKKHAPSNRIGDIEVTSVRMKHPDGYHVDVVSTPTAGERDRMLLRMNVDDFEEAYGTLTAHGYRNVRGDQTIDVKSSKAATMEGPSGSRIAIVKHIKDHD
jgi:hypothetical protein